MQTFLQRGGLWVLGQGVLMLGNLLAPLWWRADWGGRGTVVAGGVLLVVSGAFGLAGMAALGRSTTVFPAPRPSSQLVRHGIYRFVRHPLYTSVIGFAFGWGLCWRSGVGLASAVTVLVFLEAKARREEHWLRERFPGYADYARHTKRFVPWMH